MTLINLVGIDGCSFTSLFNLVREASEACLAIYHATDFEVKLKEDRSPVTAADLAVHDIISNKLKELTPEIPLISEEAKTPFCVRKEYQTYWLLDPIDGTKEFIIRSGEFTINLGLIKEGRPVFGIVQVPVQNKLYFGGSAVGASFSCTPDSSIKEFSILASLEVAKITEHTDRLVVACSKDHSSPQDDQFILRLATDFFVKKIRLGSTLKQVQLAEGKVHFCPRAYAPYDWDLAAVHAVVQGAGGDVVSFEGKPLIYNSESQRLGSFIAVADLKFNWKNYI